MLFFNHSPPAPQPLAVPPAEAISPPSATKGLTAAPPAKEVAATRTNIRNWAVMCTRPPASKPVSITTHLPTLFPIRSIHFCYCHNNIN